MLAAPGVATLETIGTVTVSVDAPGGNVTDSWTGAKIGLAASAGPLPGGSSDALRSTVSGTSRVASGWAPVRPLTIPFFRDTVTVKAPSCWVTYALDVLTTSCVCTREGGGADALTALSSARLSSGSTWMGLRRRDL